MNDEKKWVNTNQNIWKLHFTMKGEDRILLSFSLTNKIPNQYTYSSEILNVEYDVCIFDSLNDAKEEFENKIENYLLTMASYYDDIYTRFISDYKGGDEYENS